MVVHQHVPDRLRGVEQEARATEKGASEDLFLVSCRGMHRKAVGTHTPGEIKGSHVIGRRFWFGGINGRDFAAPATRVSVVSIGQFQAHMGCAILHYVGARRVPNLGLHLLPPDA